MNETISMQNFRSTVLGWEYFKTYIWGEHRWDFFKPILPYENKSLTEILSFYSKPTPAQTKKIKEYSEKFTNFNWLPLNRLYIKMKYNNDETGETRILDIAKKEHREFFLSKNKITASYFFRWALYVKDWEGLDTLNDIIDNFWTLFMKFKFFIRNDIHPEKFRLLFNSKLESLEDHNIEPIINLDEKQFYRFITHPKVAESSTKNSLNKLFFFIQNSDFLKGRGQFYNFKPTFEKYIDRLDTIFAGASSNGGARDAHKYRRLKENELRGIDPDSGRPFIDSTVFIPDRIKKEYGIKGWDFEEKPKPEAVTFTELTKYKKKKSIRENQTLFNILKNNDKERKKRVEGKRSGRPLEEIRKTAADYAEKKRNTPQSSLKSIFENKEERNATK